MSGTVGDLTVNQKDNLEQFRKRMGDDLKPEEKKDDYFLLRWLRDRHQLKWKNSLEPGDYINMGALKGAFHSHNMEVSELFFQHSVFDEVEARDFDLNKSEEMLRNHMKWRKDNKIDTIIQDFKRIEVLETYYPMTFIGFDKEGSPIRVFDFGNMDLKGLLKCAKRNDVVKSLIKTFEEDVVLLKEQTRKLEKEVETWYFIFDFENYTFGQATHKQSLELLLHLFALYEANYPERLKAAIIINASLYFSILFTVTKPLLSARTLRKVKIFGKDRWKEELLKDIDPDVLPAYLGGNRTDPNGDPRCLTIVKRGEKVPEEAYLRNPIRRLSSQSDVMRYTVSRMSKISLKLEVKEPGSLIQWEFETENRDICFGLYYQEDNSEDTKPKELVPKQRVESHIASEAGMFKCEQPGTYILMFDNSYSWLQQKEIFCRASIVRQNGENITTIG